MDVEFLKPEYLTLLVLIPLIIFVHFYSLKRGRKQALKFANYEAIRRVTGESVVSKNILILFLRIAIVLFLILAAAGTTIWYTGSTTDYDIVLAIDASSSMLAEDYSPNRLEATKSALLMFLDNLPGKINVGLVSFSGASFIRAMPTDDIAKIRKAVLDLEIEIVGGTDLGSAIITSANLLYGHPWPKVIVLLTDGQSNIGIPPQDALEYIQEQRMIIHTVGIGTEQGGLIGEIGAAFKLDENTLQDIAAATGGLYFKPVDEQSLRNTFLQIYQFDRKPLNKDLSLYFLILAIIIMILEWTLVSTKYKVI
ncbi:MAG: VWA domain-containing protein [Nanoarchaeota archaeon]|nr:VWA domain-containing protein [Nanoarchaeota archaeon]